MDDKLYWKQTHKKLWASDSSAIDTSPISASKDFLSDQSTPFPLLCNGNDQEQTVLPEIGLFSELLDECVESHSILEGGLCTSTRQNLVEWLNESAKKTCPPYVKYLVKALLLQDEKLGHVLSKSKIMKEAIDKHSQHTKSLIKKIKHHLRGSDDSNFEASSHSEPNWNYENINEDLFSILLEVEKCEKLAEDIFRPSKTKSVCEMLLDGLNGLYDIQNKRHLESNDKLSNQTAKIVLDEVVDILRASYKDIKSLGDAPICTLQLIKDLEGLKRDNHLTKMLLERYEKVVASILQAYGEIPPPLAHIKERILSGPEGPCRPEDASVLPCETWLSKAMCRLLQHVQKSPKELAEIPNHVLQFDSAVNMEADNQRELFLSILNATEKVLTDLNYEYSFVKEKLLGICPNSVHKPHDGPDFRLSELVAALLSQKNSQNQPDILATYVLFLNTFNVLIERLPLSVRENFHLETGQSFNENCAESILKAVEYIVDYSSDMEQCVGTLCDKMRQTFRLHALEAKSGTLKEKLNFLQDAMLAVCGQSCEVAVTKLGLQDQVTETIEELAQLLPSAPAIALSLDSESTVRIEPPTTNLKEMVQILKRRLLEWQVQQQKQIASCGQSRLEGIRVNEIMRHFLKTVEQLLFEMLSFNNEHTGNADEADLGDVDTTTTFGIGKLQHLPHSLSWRNRTAALPPKEKPIPAAEVEKLLNDVLERIRIIKGKYIQKIQIASSYKSIIKHLTQQNADTAKKNKKIIERIGKICSILSIDTSTLLDESALSRVSKETGLISNGAPPTCDNQNISKVHRPTVPRRSRSPESFPLSSTGGRSGREINEQTILKALYVLESRCSSDTDLVERSVLMAKLERLKEGEKRWERDSIAFREAISIILKRLAECGILIKQSLFILGSDEFAEDQVLEAALSRCDEMQSDPAKLTEVRVSANGEDETPYGAEEILALLLQKYARWTRRLEETMVDHLDNQRKVVKYLTSARIYFERPDKSSGITPKVPLNAVEDNLLDMDATLMRFVNFLLPLLDQDPYSKTKGSADAKGDRKAEGQVKKSSEDVVMQMANDVNVVTESVCPSHHRLIRLQDGIAKLHTIIRSLQCVRYLAIPTDMKQRNSGDVDFVFEDLEDPHLFVDLRLDDPKRGTTIKTSEELGRFSSEKDFVLSNRVITNEPDSITVAAEDKLGASETILEVAAANLETLGQYLRKFSSNHKMAAIIIQKDMDAIQTLLADMLQRYIDLGPDESFGDNQETLHNLHSLLSERGSRQKATYFFSRVRGEGSCICTAALEHLSKAFALIIDRYTQCVDNLSQHRQLVDNVVDLCAMYVSWTERVSLPETHALPRDILDSSIRDHDGDDVSSKRCHDELESIPGKIEKQQDKEKTKALLALPPKLESPLNSDIRTPNYVRGASSVVKSEDSFITTGDHIHTHAKVSHFVREDITLKVIAHMFQLAQVAVEPASNALPVSRLERSSGAGQVRDDIHDMSYIQQLEEQIELLKESVKLSQKRALDAERFSVAMEDERNRAQSEAALARAELRRLKHDLLNGEVVGSVLPLSSHGAVASANTREAMKNVSFSTEGCQKKSVPNPTETGDMNEVMRYLKALDDELFYAKSILGYPNNKKVLGKVGEAESGHAPVQGRSASTQGCISEADPLVNFKQSLTENYRTLLSIVTDPKLRGYTRNSPHSGRHSLASAMSGGHANSSRSGNDVCKIYNRVAKKHRHNIVANTIVQGDGAGRGGYSSLNPITGLNSRMNKAIHPVTRSLKATEMKPKHSRVHHPDSLVVAHRIPCPVNSTSFCSAGRFSPSHTHTQRSLRDEKYGDKLSVDLENEHRSNSSFSSGASLKQLSTRERSQRHSINAHLFSLREKTTMSSPRHSSEIRKR